MTQAQNVAIESSQINSSGVLQPAGGGTGVTTSTGSGSVVLSTSPTLVTPVLGTPSSGNLTSCTGYTTANLSGTISNAQLANSSVTVNSTAIALGGSATITAVNPNALTIGTGLSGTSYNGSTAVTIANSGVTSLAAGTGISVSASTGASTITNTGVTSVAAGTGISVSASTGGVTITNTSSVNSAQLAQAWVSFNNSGTILASYNVSSIGVRGTGLWTVNFSSALADGNYAMATSASPGNTMYNSGGCFCAFQYGPSQNYGAPTASAAYIYTTQGTYTGGDGRVFNPYITSCIFHR